MLRPWCLVFGVLACACSAQPAPLGATAGTSAPADSTAKASPASADCTPDTVWTDSDLPKTGWKKTGQVALTMAQGKPVSMEARSLSGAALETYPLAGLEPQKIRLLVAQAICRAGGVMAIESDPSKPENKDGVTMIDALVPEKEDEHADLERMCAIPLRSEGETPAQAIARLHFSLTWLTSKRFRVWHRATENVTMGPPENRSAPAQARADELAAAAKQAGFPSCGYVDVLRTLK